MNKYLLAALLLMSTAIAQIEIVREGGVGFHCLDTDNNILSSHVQEYKAIEACQNALLNDSSGTYSVVSTGRLRLAFSDALAQSYPGGNNSGPSDVFEPPNDPPVWHQTPSPSFTLGVSASYSLVPSDVSDPESDTLTIANETGCTLPTGVTVDDPNDEIDYDGTGTTGTTAGCIFSADDPSNPPVNSSAFSIVISDIPAAGTLYERDAFGTPRTGTSGGDET